VIADGAGRALAFALAPGQAHELPMAPGLLGCLSDIPGWVVGDRGLASHAFRDLVWDSGARPAIPPKRNEEPVACPPWIYQNRNLVERPLGGGGPKVQPSRRLGGRTTGGAAEGVACRRHPL
jgi:transposase